ncbi:MAG: PQQ-binding-like beta-propeller repeat protein [Chloroflexota bacterium]
MKRIVTLLCLGICVVAILTGGHEKTAVSAGEPQLNYLPVIYKAEEPDWNMAGGNIERTGWTPAEVEGNLRPKWYRPIEAYIPQKVQIIATMNTLFVSTSKGLYAFHSSNGADKWFYPTSMPLGHSPTIVNGIAYVGGFDKKIHAVNATTGQGIWTYEAEAGFQTSPLVVNNTVYMGSRDGAFYAVDATTGDFKWKYQTGGPILFSAAYKDNTLYFASNDSHAYALNATTGDLVWRSQKLPTAGFNSFWPVVYRDRVIFTASRNYRGIDPGKYAPRDGEVMLPNAQSDPKGTLIGPIGTVSGNWVSSTPTINMSQPNVTPNGATVPVTELLEQYPTRRTIYVLNRFTGVEYTYDFDGDGRKEYAPIAFTGGALGTVYPPVVGYDDVLYMQNWYMSSTDIPGGQISGWKLDSPHISVITSDWGARDEPHTFIAGGKYIYWNLCCDRQAGSIDLSQPNTDFLNNNQNSNVFNAQSNNTKRTHNYFAYNLPQFIPGYNLMTYVWPIYNKPMGGVYGGRNGVYGWHHDGNPPIPYNGKVYIHGSNAIIALEKNASNPTQLPLVTSNVPADSDAPVVSKNEISNRLADEVQKMIDAGHLLPGYLNGPGKFEFQGHRICGEGLTDYFHTPGETIYTLIKALPHLPANMQADARAYIQSEYNNYPPYQYAHIGWQNGAHRTGFDIPPDVAHTLNDYAPQTKLSGFEGWQINPFNIYAVWLYAEEFGGATTQLNNIKANPTLMNTLTAIPADSIFEEKPFVLNAYIAGFTGYINLAQLAGSSENLSSKQATLNALLAKRANTFSKDAPDRYFENGQPQYYYCRALNVARNFMFLTPELADYLQANATGKVNAALNEYETIAPFWFVASPEVAFGEGVRQHLYDVNAIFQAKALIQDAPHSELGQYIDVPAFPVGDLYYILNLAAALEAN